jgi:nitrile hydratase
VHGTHVFPDTNAHGEGEQPRWLYSVAFDAAELWGPQGRGGDTILLDLWEPYLERA